MAQKHTTKLFNYRLRRAASGKLICIWLSLSACERLRRRREWDFCRSLSKQRQFCSDRVSALQQHTAQLFNHNSPITKSVNSTHERAFRFPVKVLCTPSQGSPLSGSILLESTNVDVIVVSPRELQIAFEPSLSSLHMSWESVRVTHSRWSRCDVYANWKKCVHSHSLAVWLAHESPFSRCLQQWSCKSKFVWRSAAKNTSQSATINE